MNYKALYRKYRPTEFSQIVGQNNVVTILKNSIINQSFSHAYLFSGTKGTGKTSVAKILAKTINCENNINGEACNQCNSCNLINDNNIEIDIIEIDGASNNGVEEIRAIRNNINLLPMNLKYKVYIIDEIHMLTVSAFNALLKTLEEPPNHIVFIFATTEPYKIPETIISRCQWLQFEKINQSDLVKVFSEILVKEKIFFESEALLELASICDGSLRDGINSLEKVFNFSNELTLTNVKKLYNVFSTKKKIAFLQAVLNQDINEIVLVINEINDYSSDFKKFLIEILSLVQDIIIYRLTKNIKISKYLKLEEINIFDTIELVDLKLILNLFESIITLNFDSRDLKILLITKILKSFDSFKKYNLLLNLDSFKISNKEKEIENIQINEKDSDVEMKEIEDSGFINTNTLDLQEENYEDKSKININEKDNLSKTKELITIENDSNFIKNDILNFQENDTENINNNILNEEMLNNVLNVIVQANFDSRKEVEKNWFKINQLIENNKFRNFSKIYLNTKINAACDKGFVVLCDNIIQANLINKNFSYQKHRNFLNFILTKEYMIYALDKKQWKIVKEKYQSLLKINQLPSAKSILIPEAKIQEIVEQKSQTLTFLQNIFSEIEEI